MSTIILSFETNQFHYETQKYPPPHTHLLSFSLIFLALISFWSCTLNEIEIPTQVELADPLSKSKDYYNQEKTNQGSMYARIQAELEVYPYWEGSKYLADEQILIVPAHRKVQATYAHAYLRRIVFELDARDQVIRGGVLEMSTKEENLLLINEDILIEGFLNGIKSPKVTYLWSDFASRLVDGLQANGLSVERSLDRFLQSNTDVSNFNFENCIDWYWVYSNGYEEYSHTTCPSSCEGDGQDACLDDGQNGGVGGNGLETEEEEEIDIEELTNCLQMLINTLIGSTKEEFKKIFDKFEGNSLLVSMNFNVKIQYSNEYSATAWTHPKIENNFAKIYIHEENNAGATDLSLARTVMHEMLHAYLLFIQDFPQPDRSLNGLLNAYIDKYNVPGNEDYNAAHHNLFVEGAFINDIAEELKNFASALGYTDLLDDDQFFKDMAWGGLHETDVYIKMSTTDQQRIYRRYKAEISGDAFEGMQPKGKKACE